MMRTKSFFLAGLALLAGALMPSCNKDNEKVKGTEEGNTYASVTLSFGEEAFRAESEDDFNHKGEWEGLDEIKRVDIYLVDDASVSSGRYALDDFDITSQANQETKLTPKKAIKTTAGEKYVYVLINAPAAIYQELAVTNKAAFEAAWKKVYLAHALSASDPTYATEAPKAMKKFFYQEGASTAAKDVIMMSNSEVCKIDVQPNVTYAEAMDSASPKNRAKAKVKRAAARVVLTTKAKEFNLKNEFTGEVIGKITDIKYAVAQGEKGLYIQQLVDGGIIKTPAYNVVTGAFADPTTIGQMDNNYDYSDLFEKNRIATVQPSGLTPKQIGELGHPAFLLEANHKRNTAPNQTPATYDGDFRRGNTPYILVRAKFIPEDAAFAEGNSKTEMNPDGTFYVGTTTGKIYSKLENVTDKTKGGLDGQKHLTYKAGKVLYYAYVNPDIIERPKTLNAPAFRNNVYHVHINDIKKLGFNWNPLYPENPDVPNPVNPDPKPKDDDPTPPVKPNDPLGDKDIYMSVAVQVLKWNVHSYEVDLGL